MDIVAEAHGFTFLAHRGTRVLGIMGDEVALAPEMELTAALPAPAMMTLMKDGNAVATKIGSSWSVPVAEPGVYRLEAARVNKPWLFSNPIYVRAALPETPAPASSSTTEPPAPNAP